MSQILLSRRSPGHGVEVEGRCEAPAAPAGVVEQAGVAKVVVGVADEEVKGQTPPQLVDVGDGVGARLQQYIHELGVGVRFVTPAGLQHGGGGDVGDPAAARGAVKTPDHGDGGALDQFHSRRRGADACPGGQVHGQHFAPDNVALVRLARKLAQGQPAVGIQDRGFGAGAAQGGALPQQALQVFRALHTFFQRPGGVQHLVQLHQRRNMPVAPTGMQIGPTPRIEQAQRPDTGFVVHPGEKIDGRQWREIAILLVRFGVRAANDPLPPGVRRRVFQGTEKHALRVLDAGDRMQVWRDREESRIPQPALVIAEGAALAAAQLKPPDKSAFRAEVDVEILALRLLGRHQKPSSSSSSLAVWLPFVGALDGPAFVFLPPADRTR